MTMHNAKIESSKRLQSVLALLKGRGSRGATTWEIMQECRCLAPGTTISELRKNGYTIECSRDGSTQDGRKVYRYTLRQGQGDLFE